MKNLKKLIEQAIESCHGGDLNVVRDFLQKALKETKRTEQKLNKKQEITNPQWKFDINTSSLQNLNSSQIKNLVTNIEKMIESETKKIKNKNIKNNIIFE